MENNKPKTYAGLTAKNWGYLTLLTLGLWVVVFESQRNK